MTDLQHYIALGDSISIDLYPSIDHREANALPHAPPLGAASLFFRNDDRVHPEFRGRDLVSLAPQIGESFADFTVDGATTEDVLAVVRRLPCRDEKVIVTITAGGNDLLAAAQVRGLSRDTDPARETAARLEHAVTELLHRMPNAQVILSTVYDPTDGTYLLPTAGGYTVDLRALGPWLIAYNEAVRELAASDPRLHLADIHDHFRGHGLAAVTEKDCWYWSGSIIEPGVRGASEVRRLFLDGLRAVDARTAAA